MVNEFHDRRFTCASFVPKGPGYEDVAADQRSCAVQGSQPGQDFVGGTAYVETAFSYQWNNRWRNFGIIVVITVFLFIAHLVMTELVASERSKGEVLVFRRSKMARSSRRHGSDEETGSDTVHQGEKFGNSGTSTPNVQKQQSVFHWEGVNYEVQIKGETRKILDSVDGWIKPGTLTALMVSDSRLGDSNQSNSPREYQALARPPYSTSWQAVPLRVSSLEASLSTDVNAMRASNVRPGMRCNKICTLQHLLSVRRSSFQPCFDSRQSTHVMRGWRMWTMLLICSTCRNMRMP